MRLGHLKCLLGKLRPLCQQWIQKYRWWSPDDPADLASCVPLLLVVESVRPSKLLNKTQT